MATNIINGNIFGRRFSYHDQEFIKQFKGLSKRISAGGIGFLSPFVLLEKFLFFVSLIPEVNFFCESLLEKGSKNFFYFSFVL